MFASRVQRDITVKVGDPEDAAYLGADEIAVTIRKLSGASLDKARIQAAITQAAPLRALGADLLKGIQSSAVDEAAKALAAKKSTLEGRKTARYAAYDRETVLVQGVVRWSCEDKAKLNPQNLADLDEDAAQKIHEAVLDLSLPPLDPAEAEAEGKGDSGPSTSS